MSGLIFLRLKDDYPVYMYIGGRSNHMVDFHQVNTMLHFLNTQKGKNYISIFFILNCNMIHGRQ